MDRHWARSWAVLLSVSLLSYVLVWLLWSMAGPRWKPQATYMVLTVISSALVIAVYQLTGWKWPKALL